MRIGVEGMPWKPGIQPTRRQRGLSDGLRNLDDGAMKKIPVGATAFGCIKRGHPGQAKWKSRVTLPVTARPLVRGSLTFGERSSPAVPTNMNASTPQLTRAGLSALSLIVALLVTSEASSGQEVNRGQNDTPPADAPVLRAAPVPAGQGVELDGYLREFAWQTAAPITEFTQQDPDEGAEPTEASEIRILIDGVALYIGAMFFDDSDGILAHQKRRDESLGTDDRFMWILDTFLDGRTGYFFEINPAGLMGDGLLGAGGNVNKAWDGVWEARVQRLGNGWSAEIRIPWSTLNFNPESDTWGVNFQRTIRRKTGRDPLGGAPENRGVVATHPRRTPDGPLGHVTGHWSRSEALRCRRLDPTNDAGGSDELPTRAGVRPRIFDYQQPAGRGVLQHRLRGSGSRPAAGEPDPVSPPVPRATRLLPRRIGGLPLRPRQRCGALFQPAHRTSWR